MREWGSTYEGKHSHMYKSLNIDDFDFFSRGLDFREPTIAESTLTVRATLESLLLLLFFLSFPCQTTF